MGHLARQGAIIALIQAGYAGRITERLIGLVLQYVNDYGVSYAYATFMIRNHA